MQKNMQSVFVLLLVAFSIFVVEPSPNFANRRRFKIPRLRMMYNNDEASRNAANGVPIHFDTKWFNATLDHFDFSNEKTFPLRYLVNDDHFAGNGSPIFFYAGNEGDIELFANNTGFMWELAPEFKASLLFVEHRYYGKSLPFGNDSFASPKQTKYLSSEQALADFVDVIASLKSTKGSPYKNSPVIGFGGSYGGMLAAWMRMKYPNVLAGALAASAPIWEFTGLTPCDSFNLGVTKAFTLADSSKFCTDSIRRSWAAINDVVKSPDGLTWLTATFHLCKPLTSADELKDWLAEVYGDVAMVNYPYPTNFLAPLPAWPVRLMCQHLHNHATGQELLIHIRDAIMIYANYTGKTKCLDMSQAAAPSLGMDGWDYQTCTEMTMPFCANGKTDFFEPYEWDLNEFSNNCYAKWGVKPRPFWIEKYYWGKNISAASNIIFSNGDLDPWSGGGVLAPIPSPVYVIRITEGAHHLDLRASNPNDPVSVVQARNEERMFIKRFLHLEMKHRSPDRRRN